MVAAGALVVALGAAGVFFFILDSSPPIDQAERAAVESFTRAILNTERGRELVAIEFQEIGSDIRTTEFDEVFETLESVIRQQDELAQEVRALDSPSNLTALAHTLLADSYKAELEGYRMLYAVAGLAQAAFPGGTARRIRRMDGYPAAVSRLSSAERSRVRAYEEIEELLDRVGLSLAELSLTN